MTLLYNLFLHSISSAIHIYIAYSFLSTYFKSKSNSKNTFLVFLLSLTVFTVTLTFFFEIVLLRLLVSIITLVILSFLFRMKWYYRAIMPIALYALLAICENLTCALITLLFNIDMKTSVSGKYFVIGLFLSKLISFLVIKILHLTKYSFTHIKLNRSILAAIFVPISTMAVILLQYSFIINTDEISMPVSFLSLFCYSSLVVSNFLVFDWINYVAQSVEKDTKLAAANELVAIQKERYDSMLEHNRNIQKIKHDQKNLFIGLLSELERGNNTAVRRTIQNELDVLNDKAFDYSDGVVDALIEHKSAKAKAKGIEIEASFLGTQMLNVPSVDLSVILGNALDNAIEATEKTTEEHKKKITVSLKCTKNTIVITIKNPTKDDVDVNALVSTKSERSMHGFGILSIKNIAEKYCGEVIFSYSDYEFTTHIVMRNMPTDKPKA